MLTTANSSAYECRKLHRKVTVCVSVCVFLPFVLVLQQQQTFPIVNCFSPMIRVLSNMSTPGPAATHNSFCRERERRTAHYPISGMQQTLHYMQKYIQPHDYINVPHYYMYM